MFYFAEFKSRTSLKFSLGFHYSHISKAKHFTPNLGCYEQLSVHAAG